MDRQAGRLAGRQAGRLDKKQSWQSNQPDITGLGNQINHTIGQGPIDCCSLNTAAIMSTDSYRPTNGIVYSIIATYSSATSTLKVAHPQPHAACLLVLCM